MQRTNKNNQFFDNGLIITDSKIWLNKSTSPVKEGQDYRVATLSLQMNGSLWINNVKVFEKPDPKDAKAVVWYIKLPGSFLRTQRNPKGKQFDHVRMSQEQFAILRNYCYDRVDEAQDSADSEADDDHPED